jgi:hypothetical protein
VAKVSALANWHARYETYIAAADACLGNMNEDIVRVLKLGDWPVFEGDVLD